MARVQSVLMTFRSKVDALLLVIPCIVLGSSAVVLFNLAGRPGGPPPGAAAAPLLLCCVIVWMFLSTEYVVDGAELLVRSGLWRKRIDIRAIEQVTPTH